MGKLMDLFDLNICTECGKDCHFGSGRFVNRYPRYTSTTEGWVCGDCEAQYDEENE